MKTTKDFLIAKKRSAPAPIEVPAVPEPEKRFYVVREYSGATANNVLFKQVTRGFADLKMAMIQADTFRQVENRKTRKSRQKTFYVMELHEVK